MSRMGPFMMPNIKPIIPENKCLVTMIYDLKSKEKTERRSLDQYLKHVQPLLKLHQNIIFFVETEWIKQYILKYRDVMVDWPHSHNLLQKTYVIVKPFEKLKYYDILENIKEADLKSPIKNMNPEKDTPNYRIIGWNKFQCLREAIEIDPFKSKRFAWIDFGISYRANFPSNMNIIVDHMPDKVRVGLFNNLRNYGVDKLDFYQTQQRVWDAGFFAGKKENMMRFVELFEKYLGELLKDPNGYRPLEDQICAKIILNNEELFNIFWSQSHVAIFDRWLN